MHAVPPPPFRIHGTATFCMGVLLAGLLLAGLLPLRLAAQDLLGEEERQRSATRVGAGFTLSWEAGFPLDLTREAGAVDWCACDGRGTSWNQRLGVGTLLRLANMPWNGTALAGRLSLAWGMGRFTSQPYVTDPVLDPRSGVIVTPTVEFVAEAYPLTLGFDAAIELPIARHLALTLGPWMHLRLSGSFTLYERLIAPQTLEAGGFHNGQRRVAEGPGLASDAVTGGLAGGLVWNLPVSDDRLLRLGLGARTDLVALDLRQGWRSLSAVLDVGLIIGGTAAPDIAPLSPRLSAMWAPVIRTESPASDVERRLSASIDLFSRDARGERMQRAMVRTTRARMEQSCVLNPVIPFERHAAQIPSRYVLISQERAATYVSDRLARPTPVELVYDILNVVGYRMRIHSSEQLVVRGSVGPDEAPALALARAEAVAQYLRSTWGIPAARLRVDAGTVAAGRRFGTLPRADDLCAVELSVQGESPLLAPWRSAWDVEDFSITPVFLDPAIVSDDDIDAWRIVITQADREIATFTNARESMQEHVDLSVLVRESNGLVPPLHVSFEVTDRKGRTSTAFDTLDIVSPSDGVFEAGDLLPSRTRTVDTWVVDGSDLTFSQRGRSNREHVRDIVTSISVGDAITIAPLLEGGAGAALATAQQRREQAQHVASVLLIEAGERKPNIHLAPGRYTYAAPSGDLPELGFLTSLVAIIIEHEAGRR